MKTPGIYPKLALIAVGLVAAIAVYQNFDIVTRVFGGNATPSPPSSGEPVGSTPAGSAAARPREAGPAELALVAPLVKGGKLLDYTIVAIYGVESGAITVVLAKDKALVYLTVAMASDAGPLALAVVGPYAIFKSMMNVPEGDIDRLWNAFSEIIKANAGVPAPPGLSTYTPGPMPAPPR